MKRGFKRTGTAMLEELRTFPGIPSRERTEQGPVALIECIEEFPCNPCEEACRHRAIWVGHPITNLPRLKEEDCVGCGECLPKCPGLAIFLMDVTYSKEEASVSFPYEFLPLPRLGDEVEATDRAGAAVTRGRVIEVDQAPGNDRTPIVTLAVPKKFAWQVRGIRRKRK